MKKLKYDETPVLRRRKAISLYKYETEQITRNYYFTLLVGGRCPEKSAPAFESFRKIFLRTDLKSK
jgi:hypothetical protein